MLYKFGKNRGGHILREIRPEMGAALNLSSQAGIT